MVRAPCCEKMGLKKGPWSSEEDHILINYINKYGHTNWRALPKQAGLLRCGKSCRLRWTNYLRPDIKRGNFTREEEDTIIKLHEMLGNRWSAIAARLPGRTDNEIKNVWHTHLKKRLPQNQKNPDRKRNLKQTMDTSDSLSTQGPKKEQDPVSCPTHVIAETTEEYRPLSPPQCSSDMSTLTTSDNNEHNSRITSATNDMSVNVESPPEDVPVLDDEFWSEVLSADNSGETNDFPAIGGGDQELQFPFSPLVTDEVVDATSSLSMCDSMDFWFDVYSKAEEFTELLEL